MTTLPLDLPDPLAAALARAADKSGCNAQDIARMALREFLLRDRLAMLERHQLEDVAESLREAGLVP